MAESVMKGYFPSQVVSDAEKVGAEYGLQVAKAIEYEWFDRSNSNQRYNQHQTEFHKLRLYARGWLLYTSPSPRDVSLSRMPSSA